MSASVDMAAAAAASDTNLPHFDRRQAQRLGGGPATTLVAGTTQVTGGVNSLGGGLLVFQEVSLGTLSVSAIAAGDVLTFKSVKTSSGCAPPARASSSSSSASPDAPTALRHATRPGRGWPRSDSPPGGSPRHPAEELGEGFCCWIVSGLEEEEQAPAGKVCSTPLTSTPPG